MCSAWVIQSAWVVQSAWVHQCQSVGGPIADECGPKYELYSRKTSVIGFLSLSERLLIVLLGHPFCLDWGVLQARDEPSIWKQSFLMVPVSMMFLGDNLPRISICVRFTQWAGRWRRVVCMACINLDGYRPV